MNIQEKFHIRCKCQECGRTQVRKITDILNDGKCYLGGGLKSLSCGGALNYYTEDREDAVQNCAALLGFLNVMIHNYFINPKLAELLDTVADDVGHWMEGEQTPMQMGWVDCHGLP